MRNHATTDCMSSVLSNLMLMYNNTASYLELLDCYELWIIPVLCLTVSHHDCPDTKWVSSWAFFTWRQRVLRGRGKGVKMGWASRGSSGPLDDSLLSSPVRWWDADRRWETRLFDGKVERRSVLPITWEVSFFLSKVKAPWWKLNHLHLFSCIHDLGSMQPIYSSQLC